MLLVIFFIIIMSLKCLLMTTHEKRDVIYINYDSSDPFKNVTINDSVKK